MNVTVPFKQSVLKFLDDKSDVVKQTNSVNTIYNKMELYLETTLMYMALNNH